MSASGPSHISKGKGFKKGPRSNGGSTIQTISQLAKSYARPLFLTGTAISVLAAAYYLKDYLTASPSDYSQGVDSLRNGGEQISSAVFKDVHGAGAAVTDYAETGLGEVNATIDSATAAGRDFGDQTARSARDYMSAAADWATKTYESYLGKGTAKVVHAIESTANTVYGVGDAIEGSRP